MARKRETTFFLSVFLSRENRYYVAPDRFCCTENFWSDDFLEKFSLLLIQSKYAESMRFAYWFPKNSKKFGFKIDFEKKVDSRSFPKMLKIPSNSIKTSHSHQKIHVHIRLAYTNEILCLSYFSLTLSTSRFFLSDKWWDFHSPKTKKVGEGRKIGNI